MGEPKISVIIPVYNTGKYLRPCLDSISNQTHRNLQIILVDDGSSDGSGNVCDEYAAKDSRIAVVHQRNGGVSKARNAGLAIADGDFYSFPDSDDYLEPDTYEYLLRLVRKYACDAVSFEYFVTYPDRETAHLLGDGFYGLKNREQAHDTVITGAPFAWNKLFSKGLVKPDDQPEGIKFREDIYRGEDSLFVHTALARAERVWFDKRALYHYVQSEQSACRGSFKIRQLSGLRLFEEYRPLFQERYPKLWERFLSRNIHLPVSLYCDMYADDGDYTSEMNSLMETFRKQYAEVLRTVKLPAKARVKLELFRHFPKLYCKLHKRL